MANAPPNAAIGPGRLVLSHFQMAPLLLARQRSEDRADSSPDLGRTGERVRLTAAGVSFAGGELSWAVVERIHQDQNKCFVVTGALVAEARVFSPVTGWVRSLFPTAAAPTTLVAGFTMHRIVSASPEQDTAHKVAGASPVIGRVLDTATGLGYTAILAAQTAREVVTVELDPAALELAALNPWSNALFDGANITQQVGDVAAYVSSCADGSFDRVIHDPPTLKLAGELYSAAFYRDLHRVLAKGGRLSHYVGDPDSASGARTTRGVMARLQEAGFAQVLSRRLAHGIVAIR